MYKCISHQLQLKLIVKFSKCPQKLYLGAIFNIFLGKVWQMRFFLKNRAPPIFLTFAKPLFHAKHDKTEKIKVGLSPSKKIYFFTSLKAL